MRAVIEMFMEGVSEYDPKVASRVAASVLRAAKKLESQAGSGVEFIEGMAVFLGTTHKGLAKMRPLSSAVASVESAQKTMKGEAKRKRKNEQSAALSNKNYNEAGARNMIKSIQSSLQAAKKSSSNQSAYVSAWADIMEEMKRGLKQNLNMVFRDFDNGAMHLRRAAKAG